MFVARFVLRRRIEKHILRLSVASYSSPLSLYKAKINDGVINPDPKQLKVIDQLESLHHDLTRHHATVVSQNSSKLSKDHHSSEQNPPVSSPCVDTTEQKICPPKGLYIHGDIGTGKTMLMEMLYDSLPIQRKLKIHFHSFLLDVLSRIHQETMSFDTSSSDPPIHRIAQDIFQSSPIIFLDELQLADYTSTAILLNLFESLFNQGAVVVATSNRPLAELGTSSIQNEDSLNASELGQLISRNCNTVCLSSRYDYRYGMYSNQQKYYYPLNAENEFQMSLAFEDSIKSSDPARVAEVNVYGRKVQIPEATSCGVCRFDFQELCCSPLGTADYITICNTFHTIFLHNVPVLYFEHKNEARRFINFIDAAYESRVQLYCSAADEPELLLKLVPQSTQDDPLMNEMLDELTFSVGNEKDIDHRRLSFVTGRDEIFAFRRAISRLKEMQSAKYSMEPHRKQYFDPYVSTEKDQQKMEEIRKKRLKKKLEEQRLLEESDRESLKKPNSFDEG